MAKSLEKRPKMKSKITTPPQPLCRCNQGKIDLLESRSVFLVYQNHNSIARFSDLKTNDTESGRPCGTAITVRRRSCCLEPSDERSAVSSVAASSDAAPTALFSSQAAPTSVESPMPIPFWRRTVETFASTFLFWTYRRKITGDGSPEKTPGKGWSDFSKRKYEDETSVCLDRSHLDS